MDVAEPDPAEKDRGQTGENHATQREQSQHEAGDRLAAEDGRETLLALAEKLLIERFVGTGDDKFPTAFETVRPASRVLIPSVKLLTAPAGDENGHGRPLSRTHGFSH